MSGLDPRDPADAHHLLEALWVHQQHNVRDGKLLGKVLNSPHPHAQIAAKTVQHLWYTADPTKGSAAVEEVKVTANEPPGVFNDTPEVTEVRIAIPGDRPLGRAQAGGGAGVARPRPRGAASRRGRRRGP